MKSVKYALYLPNHGVFGDAQRLADLAVEAEAAGWDGFFIWDHIAAVDDDNRPRPVVDPWVALAAVALRTERLQIGTTVTPLPRRRPWKLARETVSLDRLSGGRLTLGVGIGLRELEWDDLGEETDARLRGQMLDEGLEVLTGLWSGEPFSFTGQHYHVKDACFLPTPLQTPRIPIWVGGYWPKKAPFERMARWDGMFPLFPTRGEEQLEQLKDAVAHVQRLRRKLGKEGPFDVANLGVTSSGDLDQIAGRVRKAAAAGMTWWLELLIPEIYGAKLPEAEVLERMRERVRRGMPEI